MVTGASTADAAVILVDATRTAERGDGTVELLPQTRRHSALARLLGLRHVVVAVNKMDLVAAPERRFEQVRPPTRARGATRHPVVRRDSGVGAARRQRRQALGPLGLVPRADAARTAGAIDLVDDNDVAAAPLRFAVQGVDKVEAHGPTGARRYLGRVGAGTLREGQPVRVLPAGTPANVAAIETFDGPLSVAVAGQSIALRLDRELDVSRGDWIVADDVTGAPVIARLLRADLAWLDAEPLAPQRRLWLLHGTRFLLARVRRVESVLDLGTGAWGAPAGESLSANDIGRVVLETQQPLPFDPYERVRASGAVVLIDATTQHTVAAGMLREAVST